MGALVVGVEQTRKQGSIGASDAAAALGMAKYLSPLTLWRRLRGEHVDDDRPAFVQEAALFGQLFEPVIRGKYASDRQCLVMVPTRSLPFEDWLHATPDGIVIRSTVPESVGTEEWDGEGVPALADGNLQIKMRSAYLRDEWLSGVPAETEVQVRVEMAVCDLPWSDVACLIGGNHLVVHRVERDLELEANILRDLRAFWQLVQTGKEPPVDSSDAWRDYASSKMRATKVTMQADEDVRELVEYWLEQRRKRLRAEEEEEAAKTDLLLRLSAAGATAIDLGGDRRVTAYQTGSRANWKAYAQSLGGSAKVPEQFKGKPGTWTLRAPGDDE